MRFLYIFIFILTFSSSLAQDKNFRDIIFDKCKSNNYKEASELIYENIDSVRKYLLINYSELWLINVLAEKKDNLIIDDFKLNEMPYRLDSLSNYLSDYLLKKKEEINKKIINVDVSNYSKEANLLILDYLSLQKENEVTSFKKEKRKLRRKYIKNNQEMEEDVFYQLFNTRLDYIDLQFALAASTYSFPIKQPYINSNYSNNIMYERTANNNEQLFSIGLDFKATRLIFVSEQRFDLVLSNLFVKNKVELGYGLYSGWGVEIFRRPKINVSVLGFIGYQALCNFSYLCLGGKINLSINNTFNNRANIRFIETLKTPKDLFFEYSIEPKFFRFGITYGISFEKWRKRRRFL